MSQETNCTDTDVVLFRHHQLTFELDDEKLDKEVKKVKLALSMPLRHRGVVEVWLHLTSALDGGEPSTSYPRCFTSGKQHHYPLNGRLVGPQS